MSVLLPLLTFVTVFAAVMVWNRRSQKTIQRIERHQMVVTGAGAMPVQLQHIPLLGENGRISSAGQLAERLTRKEIRTKSGKLLREAGNPQSLASYLITRLVCTFVLMPIYVYWTLSSFGISLIGIVMALVAHSPSINCPSSGSSGRPENAPKRWKWLCRMPSTCSSYAPRAG